MSAGHMWAQEQALDARPTPTPEQWAAWERIVRDKAPDLAEMLLDREAS